MNLLRFRLRNLEAYQPMDYSCVFSVLLITVTVVPILTPFFLCSAIFPEKGC
jgi:hypothetical protein